jgi:1-acyl-sn-glycerol-3-phosphate acyltransferase
MKLFRSIFFYIILAFSTIVFGSSATIGSFISRQWARNMARFWGRANLWGAGVKVIVSGGENINPHGPYILASNHQSWFDIFAALSDIPIHFSWLAKEELFKIPILGRAMYSAGYIPINRTDRRQAMVSMNKAAEAVRNGTSIFIFPEGTRSPDGVMGEFKKGGFVLAAKSHQPIVPISISGSYKILPKSGWQIHPGPIRITIGKPIMPSATGGTDAKTRDLLMEQVRKAILSNLTDEEAGRVAQPASAGNACSNGGGSSSNG